MNMNRRRFLFGLGASAAIVQATNIMPISVWDRPPRYWGDGIHDDAPYLNWLIQRAAERAPRRVVLEQRLYYMKGSIAMPERAISLDGNLSTIQMLSDVPVFSLRSGGHEIRNVFVDAPPSAVIMRAAPSWTDGSFVLPRISLLKRGSVT